MKIKNISGIIISGGQSSRVGTDKALLDINGKTIIERIYSVLSEIFDEIIVVTNNTKNYPKIKSKIVSDIYPGFGPLSGIHSGLLHSNTDSNFVISVDMPFVSRELIEFMINYKSERDIIIPASQKILHMLCAVYGKGCLETAQELLKRAYSEKGTNSGKTKVRLLDLINISKTEYVDISNEPFFREKIVFNMNTVSDYEYVKSILLNKNI
jgi:molybdopterin-guanine dinucleotide biosynthesis protein A